MIFKNKTIQKLISSLMVIAILTPSLFFFFTPKQASAQFVISDPIGSVLRIIGNIITGTGSVAGVTNTAVTLRNVAKEIGRQILMAVARRTLSELTRSTVQWINTGNFGQPLFLTSPKSFFRDIAKGQIEAFIGVIGHDSLRFPFGREYALQVIDSYKSQFETNAQYTLSTAIRDPRYLRSFQNDFNVGGWNGFLINTQYPQNNAPGFRMIATQSLGQRLEGTSQSVGNQVQSTLQQGMGFLSPQVCSTNPNLIINPYRPPSFTYDPPDSLMASEPRPGFTRVAGITVPTAEWLAWKARYDAARNAAQATWTSANTCRGRMITTTPGSVAGSQITRALNSQFSQSELGQALGNSLGAIFDAIINKFMSDGLSALASRVNPEPVDEWNYEGQTLGVPGNNVNGADDWGNIPDEIVDVLQFKKDLAGETIITKADGTTLNEAGDTRSIHPSISGETVQYIQGAIANTEEELLLMDQYSINSTPSAIAGITQMMEKVSGQVKSLDQCLPGPDKGWEARLGNEKQRNDETLSQVLSKAEEDRVNVTQTLSLVVSVFKDYLNSKIISSLPNGIIFMDEISKLDTFTQQAKETTDARREKSSTLARLKSIQASLNSTFPTNTNPAEDSSGERALITLRKSYKATQFSISNTSTIENTRAQLQNLLDQSDNLVTLNTQCNAERLAAGWEAPTGIGEAKLSSEIGKQYILLTQRNLVCTACSDPAYIIETPKVTTGTEIEQFCELPLIGGHEEGEILSEATTVTGINEGNHLGDILFRIRTKPWPLPFKMELQNIPIVNAANIKTSGIDVAINCKLLWKANNINYTRAGDPSF